ncbi:MAG: pyrroline-5-carboxylate reductase [Chloroflexota bacterium]
MSAFRGKNVTFIGGGMMGTAMIGGMLKNNLLSPDQIMVADPSAARGHHLTTTYGVTHVADNAEAIKNADVVVLAVKPQFFDQVAADIGGRVGDAEVIVSIMAGVTIATIAEKLEVMRVVRSIPNTPAAIGRGITAWLGTESVSENGMEMARLLLESLGETIQVPEEKYMDMATAVSGSGPGYVFLFMEAMMDAAVHMGFSRSDAEKLVMHTVSGAAAYAMDSDEHVAVLRNQVTSPGGTTAEGLYHMEKNGLRAAVSRGMWGAFQRSVALGGGDPRDPDTSI